MKVHFRRLLCAVLCCAVLTAFGPASAAGTKLPILMYHNLTNDPSQTSSMTVTDVRFRLDMEFLQQFGYTPVLPAELIAIHNGTQTMPEKPVMITFDDGYRSNYDFAYPVLQKTGMRAVIAVIAYNIQWEDTDSPDRHAISWSELNEMIDSGTIEVGSHTYNLHNPAYHGSSSPDGIDGVMRLRGESSSAYTARVGADFSLSLSMILQNTHQNTVNYFSYPYGAYDSWMQPLLNSNGIGMSTLTNPGVANIATGMFGLPRYRITMDEPLSSLLQQKDRATSALASVLVNGTAFQLPAYNINGNNYVRVRDVATLLKDTASGYDVQWDAEAKEVVLVSHTPYTPLGTENKTLPAGARMVKSIEEPTVADGVANMVAAYNVDGNTFYKLRSLGDLCNFTVDWDEATRTVMVTA